MPANSWWETECRPAVCRATGDARVEIYWAHKKLCEVKCLKMYRFFQYTLWLKVYNIQFYCHLRPDSFIEFYTQVTWDFESCLEILTLFFCFLRNETARYHDSRFSSTGKWRRLQVSAPVCGAPSSGGPCPRICFASDSVCNLQAFQTEDESQRKPGQPRLTKQVLNVSMNIFNLAVLRILVISRQSIKWYNFEWETRR